MSKVKKRDDQAPSVVEPQINDPKKILTTLNTCRGQVEGIIKMIENDRYCIDVSNQIMAAQSLLAKANKMILVNHLHTCVLESAGDKEALIEKTEELTAVFNKLLK